MATKPTLTKDVKDLNSVDVFNAVRQDAGAQFASVIPRAVQVGDELPDGRIATQADVVMSLRGIGQIMMQFTPMQNMFLSTLVNRIAHTIITSRLYQNPWSGFKKGLLEYGETVEEIFVQMAKPYQYDMKKEGSTVFAIRKPDVRAAFHSLNYQKYYPTTVSNDNLRQAFLSIEGLTDLISRIIEQVYTGANYDEWLVMKYLVAQCALAGDIYPVEIDAVTADTARSATSTFVSSAKKLGFMSNKYNAAGVTTYSDISKLYTILTSDIESILDVEVLAMSFNMSKAELLGRQISVDGFGTFDNDRLALIFKDDPYTQYTPFTSEQLESLATIAGLMVDESWFMIFDNYNNMTEIYNPEELYWNYFLHVWKTFSVSPFANAVLFTTETPAVTAVSLTPQTPTVKKGSTTQFTATVTATGFAPKSVHWEVSGAVEQTTIDQNGVLTVGANETAGSVTVKATSLFDDSQSGSTTVTISAN